MTNFKKLTDSYILSNNLKIPCVGFGTWQAEDGEIAKNAVKWAIESGYRHIDTAAIYGNEESVGKAISESNVPREELFITTKLWNQVRGYDETISAFNESLKKLNISYLDLYLIHWPNPIHFRDNWQEANSESWRAFETLYNEGKIKAIGVSNFRVHHLEALMKSAKITPMVNQIRLCPGDIEGETVKYCREKNILLQAYSPFGSGKAFSSSEMKEVAKKYNKSIAQICMRWSLQNGFLPLPKSVTAERIRENTDVFDFSLSKEDMENLTNMTGVCGIQKDPDKVEF